MENLFFTIALTVSLFIIFRYFKKFRINSFYAVVINYYTCIVTGLLFLNDSSKLFLIDFSSSWIKIGLFTGSLFVPAFYLMALTVEKVSVSVASVANKISLVIPVLFGYLFLNPKTGDFTLMNMAGVFLALVAIVMTSIKKEEKKITEIKSAYTFLLPLSIFLAGGVIDTLVNYTNQIHLQADTQEIFPIILFAAASFTGTILILIKIYFHKEKIKLKDIAGGIILGVPNYFSIHFLLNTLSEFNNNAALVFPVINISVILFASLLAVILFSEKLSKINLLGIALSIISIILVFI